VIKNKKMSETNLQIEQDKENDPIIEVFNSLPLVIKNAIVNSHWEQKIRAIAKKNSLVVGDANTLEKNTFLVMLGVISPTRYASALKEEIEFLNDEKLNNIINSVEDEVFRDIKQKLIELEEEKNNSDKNIKSKDDSITKESIAAEIAEHIEIIPGDEIIKSVAGEKTDKETDVIKNQITEEKLNSVVESVIENYLVKDEVGDKKDSIKKIDPYRELLE
jgi:hypothetical protein